jgi:hypothetical protein
MFSLAPPKEIDVDSVHQGRDAKGKTVKAGDRIRWCSTPNLYSGCGKVKSIEFRPAGIDSSDQEAWRYVIVTESNRTIRRWDEEILKV